MTRSNFIIGMQSLSCLFLFLPLADNSSEGRYAEIFQTDGNRQRAGRRF